MSSETKSSPPAPSFSRARRWKIGFDALVRTALVLAVVAMANYIGSLFSQQFFFSPQMRVKLSSRTISILQTLTNRVDVTVYYDKSDGMYPTIKALLDEYHRRDGRIHVQVVDWNQNPAQARQIAEKYHFLGNSAGKNLVIFDCGGRFKVAPGEALVQYAPTGMKDKKIEFQPVAFNGEKMFTSMLLAVTNPKPFTAYFLQGDGEPGLADESVLGYMKFAEILEENYIRILPLSIVGTNDVPGDCDLLILAGPTQPFSDSELEKIDHYLLHGGRLMALLTYGSDETGVEGLLSQWGVAVGSGYVIDQDNAEANSQGEIIAVQDFSQHPAINSLSGSSLYMQTPLPVEPRNNPETSDSVTVTPLAFSSGNSVLSDVRLGNPQSFPLMVAAEQSPVKGIAGGNGGMRMIVAGDSDFLNNQYVGQVPANGDFAASAVNWLLDRPTLLSGIGPRPITEFRLLMTQSQMRDTRWLLLAALPGVVLGFGGLVWLRRRK
jgi:ABC-type uncharacterized transport system involved in gliding motility auxiliary subunit